MKNTRFKPLSILLLALGLALAFSGCEKDDAMEFGPNGFYNDLEARSGANNGILQQDRLHLIDQDLLRDQDRLKLQDCKLQIDQLPMIPMTETEINSVVYQRENQKFARDLYLKFNDSWDLAAFENMAESEQSHMDALLLLIEQYKLTDPVGNNEIGIFTDPELQIRFVDALEAGMTGEVDALWMAAMVQEREIVDLGAALQSFVENDHLQLIYSNLLTASEAHLRVFVQYLKLRDVEYEPQILSVEAFAAIIGEMRIPDRNNFRPQNKPAFFKQ